jgi:nucleolar protein 53
VEEKRTKEVARLMEVKARIGRAVTLSGTGVNGVEGMIIDSDVVDGGEEWVATEELPAKKLPERKTKQQRAKAARLRAEVRLPPACHFCH